MSNAIFLSYASQDADAARRICDALRAQGLEVWFDQSELRGGDAWDASIRKQIKECALFVPVVSATTDARSEGYFRLEWKLAVDRSHLMAENRPFLVPVILDDTSEQHANVPDAFRARQWSRLNDESSVASFASRIAKLAAVNVNISERSIPSAPHAAPFPTAAPAAPAASPVPKLDAAPSIAVLAFANRSASADDEYFSDGLADELLNVLAKIKGLRVVARTSSFAFKGKSDDVATIGAKLNVATLLEGSVRKSGNRARIAVQLVQVADSAHLWSESYDRTLDDIFAVQDDIAQAVVQELRAMLMGGAQAAASTSSVKSEIARAAKGRTDNIEAHHLYLKGREFLVGTQQEMDKSVVYFQRAVAEAPGYAMPYAGIAEAYTRQAFLRAADRTQSLSKAQAAVTRALEIDPDLAEAHTAQAMVRFYFEWDWTGAEAAFRRGLELNPGSVSVHEEYGIFLAAMGRNDEALAQSSEAVRLDPLSVGPVHDMAIIALGNHDYEKAAEGFRHTLAIDPNWTWGYIKLARTLAMQKNCKDALAQAVIAEMRIAGGPAPLSNSWLGVTYALCGDLVRARQKLDALHSLEKTQYVDPVTFALIHSALGEMDPALRWYEKAFADHTPNMVFASFERNLSPTLVGEPRFKAIVERMKFPNP